MLGYSIKQAVFILVEIIDLAILIRILLSFLPNLRNNKLSDIIYHITEPILYPCRMLLDRLGLGNGMIDFSPILAYFLLRFILTLVYRIF